MAPAALRALMGKPGETRTVVSAIADALGSTLAIEDGDGRALLGAPVPGAVARVPVTTGDTTLGWVSGGDRAAALAGLVGHLATRESERKALGSEVLHLYREINLIYSFSEKLAALLDLERVARLALQQARQLIVATDGVLLLLAEDGEALVRVAGFGDEPEIQGFRRGLGIIGAIAASGQGEIVNDVSTDRRRALGTTGIRAIVSAPLTVGERIIGIIALGSTVPMAYTAAQLKLLTTLGLQAATAIENARLFERTIESARERERLLALQQKTELARAKLESELTVASRIQANLFPSVLPQAAGYDLAARNRAARYCGGDYYDALVTGADGAEELLLCVADVAGKGLPAALVMSNMQATLRALAAGRLPLPELAQRAGDLLFAATSPEKYVTAALLRIALADGSLQFVGAGHLDNVIVRSDGSIVPLASTGLPLGLLEGGGPYGETAHRLDAGDLVVLYSDGVTDAQNADGEEFGDRRLHDLLAASSGAAPDAVADAVLLAVDGFVDGAPQFDDITILVLRRR